MMPIEPISLPFCVLFQSKTVGRQAQVSDMREARSKIIRTVEREEGERELGAGEYT